MAAKRLRLRKTIDISNLSKKSHGPYRAYAWNRHKQFRVFAFFRMRMQLCVYLSKLPLHSLQYCKGDIVVQNSLAVLQTVQRQLAKGDTQMHAHAKKSKDAKLLMTIPGIGPIRAMTLLAEIGDINRFPKAEPLCSHAGLVPTIRQSANTMHVGHCSAQANKQLKNVFVQAALTAKRMKRGNAIQTHYCNLVEKKGKQKAICAAARKMCCIVYAVLHKKEKFSFSYSSP